MICLTILSSRIGEAACITTCKTGINHLAAVGYMFQITAESLVNHLVHGWANIFYGGPH